MNKILLALLGFTAVAAHAHVTLGETSGCGTYQKLSFRVGHGCDGKATTGLTVTLPEGATHAKPMPKAGWKIDIVSSGALNEITWKGGSLPDAYFDELYCRPSCLRSPVSCTSASCSSAAKSAWRG
jgi:uncharacterized protein YcnI